MSADNRIFPALTGYRAIAAWMIFAYHYFPYQSAVVPQWSRHLFIEFRMGIDLFFVLSGFLITWRYYRQQNFSLKKYLVNRLARIYPVYMMLTVLTYLMMNFQQGWAAGKTAEFLLNITVTKALFKEYIFSGIAQGWTLTVEEIFYFSAPVIFFILKKNLRNLFILPFLLFAVFYALKQASIHLVLWGGFLQINLAKYIFDFFTGIGLALLLMRKKEFKVPRFSYTYFGMFMILAYIAVRSMIRDHLDTSDDFARAAELALLSVTGIAPLIWGLIHEKTPVSQLLSTPLFILLGKSSYVFYLIHWSFISVLITTYISPKLTLLFLLLNIISVIIYLHFEKPFNIFVKKIFLRKSEP